MVGVFHILVARNFARCFSIEGSGKRGSRSSRSQEGLGMTAAAGVEHLEIGEVGSARSTKS